MQDYSDDEHYSSSDDAVFRACSNADVRLGSINVW